MDCRTARQLLQFARPGDYDLDAADRAALEKHLANCADCDGAVRAERQLDHHLGKAIRDVPVPNGLKDRVLTKLRHERDNWWKEWMGRVTRYVAAAAAVLLVVYGGVNLWQQNKPRDDAVEAVSNIGAQYISPRDKGDVDVWLNAKNVGASAPDNFNYSYLRSFGVARIGNKDVPHLLFVRPGGGSSATSVAEVYILSGKRFKNLAEATEAIPSSDRFKVQVERPTAGDQVYVIVSTGPIEDLRSHDIKSE